MPLSYDQLLGGINRVFDLSTGGPRRPVFFDIDTTCPTLRQLDAAFPAIRDELLALLPDQAKFPRYHDLDPMQHYISARVDPDRNWKIFFLYAMGEKPSANRALCPRTSELLDHIPNLFQAFFSILDAGKSIPPHCGPYRGYLRYHLPLLVPDQNPPSIRIKNVVHTWQEGQSILFDDSWDHEVINHSPGARVVLIVDIRRPMPLPFASLNRLVEYIMRLVYGKQVLKKLA